MKSRIEEIAIQEVKDFQVESYDEEFWKFNDEITEAYLFIDTERGWEER